MELTVLVGALSSVVLTLVSLGYRDITRRLGNMELKQSAMLTALMFVVMATKDPVPPEVTRALQEAMLHSG